MVETGTVDPARQHYFVQNARRGFFDPRRQREEYNVQTDVPWAQDTNHHLGYLPLNLEGVALNRNFKKEVMTLAKDIFMSLQNRPRNFQAEHVHILFWCNQGCHRSVSFCRLTQIVAAQWRWQ